MKLSKEKIFFTAVLLFYWFSLVIATHIPVPVWVRKMGVSDKTMHFAAYMILTLLFWLASSFDIKANWRKLRPWLVLVIMLFYGIADELAQYFIAGRSTDIIDLFSDMLGVAAAMLAVTFISGYHATMLLIAIGPVFLPAIVKAKIVKQDSLIEAFLYAIVFAVITGAWLQYLSIILKLDYRTIKKLATFIAGPLLALAIVKIYALLTHKHCGAKAILCSVASIILIVLVSRFIQGRKFCKAH